MANENAKETAMGKFFVLPCVIVLLMTCVTSLGHAQQRRSSSSVADPTCDTGVNCGPRPQGPPADNIPRTNYPSLVVPPPSPVTPPPKQMDLSKSWKKNN